MRKRDNEKKRRKKRIESVAAYVKITVQQLHRNMAMCTWSEI